MAEAVLMTEAVLIAEAVLRATAVCNFAAAGVALPALLVEVVLLLLISDFFSIAMVLIPSHLNSRFLDLDCVTPRDSAVTMPNDCPAPAIQCKLLIYKCLVEEPKRWER